MNAFSFYNPVKLIFGKGQLQAAKKELPKFGKKVLLVYGGGSIKKMAFMMKSFKCCQKQTLKCSSCLE